MKSVTKGVEQGADTWFVPPLPTLAGSNGLRTVEGLGMFTLELAGNRYRPDRPDRVLDATGKHHVELVAPTPNMPGGIPTRSVRLLVSHPLVYLQWDEGWMDGVTGMIGEDAQCHDLRHGHYVATVGYHQFRNVRGNPADPAAAAYPNVRLVIMSGLDCGTPGRCDPRQTIRTQGRYEVFRLMDL